MSTTVSTGDYTVTSTHESAADMTAALGPDTLDSTEPRVLVDKGVKVDDEPEADPISKAASELGKKGGEAAAKARKAKEKESAKDAEATTEAVGKLEAAKEDAEAAAEADKDAKKGNPRHDPQARVAQATREAAEAKREASELRARLDRLERERQAPPPQREAAPERTEQPAEDAEPQEGDFESYAEYVKALARHEYRSAAREHQRQQQAHAQAQRRGEEVESLVGGWKERLQKAATDDPEFVTKARPALEGIGLPTRLLPPGTRSDARNWMADVLTSAGERAPALLLYLSEHPQELQRIASLSKPPDVAWALANLDVPRPAAVTAGSSAAREVSKAKPPVTPVTGSPHTADEPSEDDSYDEYVRKANAKEKRVKR